MNIISCVRIYICSLLLLTLAACGTPAGDNLGALLALAGGGMVSGTVFAANDGENGRELWVTDGTVGGTRMIRDINPDAGDSNPAKFTLMNGKVYFTADDGENGNELWVTDGTEKGTRMIINIYPGGGVDPEDGPYNNSSSPNDLTVVGDKLYFTASEETNGNELYATDGTASGTHLVKDIYPGPSNSNPSHLTVMGGKVYFNAADDTNGDELWVTDGTEDGTIMLKNIRPGSDSSFPFYFAALSDRILFNANDGTNGNELWVTDGTDAGTKMLKNIADGSNNGSPESLITIGNRIFFMASDTTNGHEPWVSDGTEGGTQMILDIDESGDSWPSQFTAMGGSVYFTASDEDGQELWCTTATGAGATQVKDINESGSSDPASLIALGSALLFVADDGYAGARELYFSGGSWDGTSMLKNINATPDEDSNANGFILVEGKILFSANDGINGQELWVTDGTEMGTTLLVDINPGSGSGYPYFRL